MRINVSIPDELYQQVKALDPPINVSGVCKDALRRMVNERNPNRKSDAEAVITEQEQLMSQIIQTFLVLSAKNEELRSLL